MSKSRIWNWILFLAITIAPVAAMALPLSHFTSSSRLARGHWVKIAISKTGMYQVSVDQLRQMGFNDPSKVQVFGYGGVTLNEVLTDDLPDDLQQVPILRRNDKICFYASGTVNLSLSQQPLPHFTRTRNTYSQKAYYFLTEASSGNLSPNTRGYNATSSPQYVDTSLDAYLHEQENVSVAFTGSELLGEDLMRPNRQFEFTLINPSEKRLGLTTRMAAKVVRKVQDSKASVSGTFDCQLRIGDEWINVPYASGTTNIYGCLSEYIYYQVNPNPDQNMVWVDLPDTCHTGWLRYNVTVRPSNDDAVLHLNNLDYYMVTYNHYNRLAGHEGAQCMMGLIQSSASQVVRVEGSGLIVWNVSAPQAPVQMQTRSANGHVQFTPGDMSSPQLYVAFNPNSTLYEIDGYELVENQNIHGASTPDMIIITHHEFLTQAERVAQMHREQDGMSVLVLDQDLVFNEFSSGTPNAMAIRLLCKMFYDRGGDKLKYLLVFGNQSFDNRGLVTGKQNLVISYVSAVSNNEDAGYINDDFYGYLQDNSGQQLSSDKLCIGIGHMPVADATEAAQVVDKLQEYVYSTDYSPWRNNYSLWAENSTFKKEGILVKVNNEGDTIYSAYQLHESQAAGIGYIIDHDSKAQMVRDLAFVRMFPQSLVESFKEEKKRSSTEAKRHIQEMFNEGQYFATYVGHAGASSMSATGIWTSNDVKNNSYSRLPIMTTACCDVARYDSDSRGICELMFHKRDGGAIALFTTTRQVLATLNDDLNRAFTSQMFSYNKNGVMPRLGDCYLAAKNYYNSSNTNKFHWVLLGDPAMRINYPKPLFNITAINGTALSSGRSIGASPLQRITVEAQVMDEANPNRINTNFNGDATLTIYDAERVCMNYIKGTGQHSRDTMSLNYPREKLLQVTGRVVAGKFHGTAVMPRFARTSSNPMLVSVYAHQDGTDQMVNGMYDKLVKNSYISSLAVTDNTSPVVQAMYLNNEQEFAANATVGTSATLYIRATDNTAFNTQQLAMGRNMRLTIDGGKTSYNLAKNLATVTDEGRALSITMPLEGLTPGRHTLDFMVSDVCGNATTQSITFVVSSLNDLSLQTSDIASSNKVDISLGTFTLNQIPEVHVKVTDINGNLVWDTLTSSFPCTWNLTNKRGQRVANGLYRIYGNYTSEEGYGGSNLINFVVLPAVNH